MPTALLDCVRAASGEIEAALLQANEPTFDVYAIDLTLVSELRGALNKVARASAEASAEDREQARANADYRQYLKRLAHLGAVVDAWYSRVIAHRSRLAHDGERLLAAQSWAEAYNRTR